MNKRRTYGSGESQILSTLFTPSRDSERPLVGATLMTAFDPKAVVHPIAYAAFREAIHLSGIDTDGRRAGASRRRIPL
jgi:hypothetical protein